MLLSTACKLIAAFVALSCLGPQSALQAATSLIPNGDMQIDSNNDGWPDGWARLIGNSSWEREAGNRFIRITATEPDKMLMLHHLLPIPEGVKALKLTLRMRANNLKPGQQAWFDARILMDLQGVEKEDIQPSPKPIYTRKSTDGWVERSSMFLVPEGAKFLEFMPSLFRVASGSMDIDDVTLTPVDPQEILLAQAEAKKNGPPPEPQAEAPQPDRYPKELKVVGNRLHDPEGNEVWLQGVHVVSMEWNPKGESVLASIKVAIDDWKSNVIRLSVKPEFWFGEKDNDATAYRDLIDAAVSLAANRCAYLLIDNHSYRAVRERDIAFWTEVAEKYKNHPAVLFDIINEPHGISWEVWRNGGFVEDQKKKADEDAFLEAGDLAKSKQGFQSPGMQKAVEVIRATGAKNIVVAGGLDWAYDLSGIVAGYALQDPSGNGIMYSAHIYPWKKDWQKKVLDAAALHPIFVGEVGANTKKMGWLPEAQQEDAKTWVPAVLGLIQKYKLNWSAFSFHPKASPVLISDWKYTPTPEWGAPAKAAIGGKQFALDRLR